MIFGESKFDSWKVSCVIPVYNSSETILRAVKSVLKTPGVAEIVIVDDGSTDDSVYKVQVLVNNTKLPIRLLSQKNAGAAAARNTGIQATTLKWVTFLDADDEMLPEAITSKFAHLWACADPESVDAVHGTFVCSETGAVGQFAQTETRVDPDGIGRAGGFPGGVVSYIFRRESLLLTGGFTTKLRLFEDFELILRFIANGARVIGCDVPGFRRYYIPNSLSRGTSLPDKLRTERQFLNIAAQGALLSRREIARRLLRNRSRQLYYVLTGS